MKKLVRVDAGARKYWNIVEDCLILYFDIEPAGAKKVIRNLKKRFDTGRVPWRSSKNNITYHQEPLSLALELAFPNREEARNHKYWGTQPDSYQNLLKKYHY